MKHISKQRSDTAIKTERLWLRQIDETDGESIVALRSDEAVYKYFLNPVEITLSDHNSWYKDSYINDPDRVDWIAVDDKTGAFIGIYGAKRVDNYTAEVSYITNPKHKGRGYATEAVKAIICWSKEVFGVDQIVVVVHKDNKVSETFANRLGFVKNICTTERT